MESGELLVEVREAVRKRERFLVRAYLALVALVVLVMAVAPVRARILSGLQHRVDRWDERWLDRLAYGERLVADSQYTAAAAYLARLDEEFPAQSSRHRWDKERERLLVALGTSYVKLNKHKLALATYRKLVAFDPNNYANHYALARAVWTLRPNWATPPEARDQYIAALVLNPIDRLSLDGLLLYSFEKADWKGGTAAFEHYLDALQFEHLFVKIGSDSALALVPVDGRFHDIDLPLPAAAEWKGPITFSTSGLSCEIKSIALVPAKYVGMVSGTEQQVWPGRDAWSADSLRARAPGLFEALGSAGQMHFVLEPRDAHVARVRLTLRFFKPVNADRWDVVDRSYRNRLDYAGLAATKARVLLPDVVSSQAP
ncbi:MAG: hypothetical protein ABJD11_06640 [Gemmatimonadota bacterium]